MNNNELRYKVMHSTNNNGMSEIPNNHSSFEKSEIPNFLLYDDLDRDIKQLKGK